MEPSKFSRYFPSGYPSESLNDRKTKYPSQMQIIKPPIAPRETPTKYISSFPKDLPSESFQIQMGFSFPFLRANDLRTSLLIMRTHSSSYVGLFLNIIANSVNNNTRHRFR